jgi:hypothetical protein
MRLTPLESVLNRNIAASSAARKLCRQLEGKTLAMHLTGVPLNIQFRCDGERMSLDTAQGAANATLSGSPRSCGSRGLRPNRPCAAAPCISKVTPKWHRPSANC